MADTYRPPTHDQHNGTPGESAKNLGTNEAGKTLLIGLLGGLISAAGYIVYQRLPDDQKQRINAQVRGILDERLADLKANFNL